jgi:hypothetical protein
MEDLAYGLHSSRVVDYYERCGGARSRRDKGEDLWHKSSTKFRSMANTFNGSLGPQLILGPFSLGSCRAVHQTSMTFKAVQSLVTTYLHTRLFRDSLEKSRSASIQDPAETWEY